RVTRPRSPVWRPSKNAPLSRWPAPRCCSWRNKRCQSRIGTVILASPLAAKVVPGLQQRVEFREVVDNRMVGRPYEVGLFCAPLCVAARSEAIVRMVEGHAVFPICPKHFGDTRPLLALRPLGKGQPHLFCQIPKRTGRGRRSIT